MIDKELYQEEKKVQLEDYELKLKELKDQISEFDAEANRKLEKQIKIVELEIEEAKTKLEAFKKVSREEFITQKEAIESTFIAINTNLAMS